MCINCFFFQKVVLSFGTYSPPTLICMYALKKWCFLQTPLPQEKTYTYIYIMMKGYTIFM
jgi:hypothetical protein